MTEELKAMDDYIQQGFDAMIEEDKPDTLDQYQQLRRYYKAGVANTADAITKFIKKQGAENAEE